jgi:hypothetical protein
MNTFILTKAVANILRQLARLFSQTEQGQVKYKYTCWRKVVWDIVQKLVDLGHISQVSAII